MLKYLITPTPVLLYDAYKKLASAEAEVESVVETELDYIKEVIVTAREQGLSEVSVEVSKNFAFKLGASGGIPVDGINVQANCNLDNSKNGKVVMTLKLNPDDSYSQLNKLAELHKEGVLTDSEYSEAKKRLIEKM